ncbi:LysR substrate-binding domain-containing protein [Flammeovirga sp. SubArs3]|uniref:LysR substrate-binding domain-containing protein n=1 Tax=Flammeovirga sp. SubArs3 TaxID=2995316 RepID=UPI00248B9A75|nr:LysR substrate-binding domain-containing protein [Flammeovirga sp. SubArs3]
MHKSQLLMTIQQIKYFLELAKELHFWKTAEKVYLSQSSLSRQIQSLEDELNIKLFDRDKRNVKLTNAGNFLQTQLTTKMRELDQIISHAKKIDSGNIGALSITYPGSIIYDYLPQFIEKVNHKLPELKVELAEPMDENHEKLLLEYKTDLAFSRDKINNANIEFKKLYSEPICLVVPKGHRLCSEVINGLENEKFIISGLHRSTFFSSILREWFSKHSLDPKIAIESDYGGMILSLVSKGLGITVLPNSFQSAQIENVHFIELEETIDLFINWRKNELNKVVEKVVAIAEDIGATIH